MNYISKIVGTIAGTLAAMVVFLPFWYIVCFGVNFVAAKFIITPVIGEQVCLALNTVFNTTVFTKDILPVLYATASFVGNVLFKSHLSIDKD